MAEITGEFPRHNATIEEKNRSKKNKAKKEAQKLKQKLKEAEYKLKFQKKLSKEQVKRCKAETELEFTRMLLQNHSSPPESFYTLRKRK